jgi:putative hydrolases of HD superfamily
MQIKAPIPATLVDKSQLPPLIEAYLEFNHLKQLYRQGWLRRGIPPERCESVAEHILCMALVGLFLCDSHYPDLDQAKVLRMILLHEFGEIYAGDIIPADNVPETQKHALELASACRVLGQLPEGEVYIHLWMEFEAGESSEARFVRQLDRLEMAFQASVYELQGLGDMGEFFTSAAQVVTDPMMQSMLHELKDL